MSPTKSQRIAHICQTGVIAVMRAPDSEGLLAAAGALLEGGVSAVEVTMTTAGALDLVTAARRRFESELLFGVGSVLDGETARAAISAGAQFIVAPTLDLQTIAVGNRYGVPVIPGCYTPTECLTAWQHGAALIKLFPASTGGPAYLKALLAPLPHLEIVPVGGIDIDDAPDYIRAGAAAVGIGGRLVSQELLQAGDVAAIRQRARTLIDHINSARNTSPA